MKKETGLLLGITSLPSRYGIGDLGLESYQLVDLLHDHHFTLWQVLPINPIGFGHSPYQPYSSKAGEPLLISLDLLAKEGYIDLPTPTTNHLTTIDYEAVAAYKTPYFKKAYQTMLGSKEKLASYKDFIKAQPWVVDYGIFIAFKAFHHHQSWLDWDLDYKFYPSKKNPSLIKKHQDDIGYAIFLQFIFHHQWQLLKAYCHQKSIRLIGDIPFYLGLDSVDVWMHQDQFLLDEDGHPTVVAGVPPDYFSPTGQRWGNPIYDWEAMKKDHYQFWIDRLSYMQTCFDDIRIDHFRAFDTYWQIPSTCDTAIEGDWILGPSHDFFDTIFKALPKLSLIAEDLGDLRPEVLALRDDYQLPGMQVVQFHLDPNQPFCKHENTVLYTGTHDNETLYGWFKNLDYNKRIALFQFLREQHAPDRKSVV